MAMWVASAGIFLVGAGIIVEGVKGLRPPPPGKKPKTSKGTAIACVVVGVLVMIAGAVVPFVA